MKGAISFVILLTLASVSFSQNLVVNPGFEEWTKIDKPAGWTISTKCLKDSINNRSGDYSCQNIAEINATKYLGQTIPVISGKKYNLSFYFKTIITNNEHGCRIWCHWEDQEENPVDDPASKSLLHPSEYMESELWQQFSIEMTAPATASYFCLEVRTYQNTISYWEDFLFEENVVTLDKKEELSEIVIYPNPANNYLIIKNISSLQHIAIQNITGIVTWSSAYNGERTVTIPVSVLPNGIYLIKITCANKSIIRKFIKKSN
jgi:type IX secretion system substrate protein